MKRIGYLLQKEFLQIFRNKGMLPIIFVMPFIQLVILSFAATFELNDVQFYAVDWDRSTVSREMINQFDANNYFTHVATVDNEDMAQRKLAEGAIDMILKVPVNMDRKLESTDETRIQLIIDAVNGSKAGLIQSYSQSVIQQFNSRILPELQTINANTQGTIDQVRTTTRHWYNSELDYINYMVPGILVVLVTMIGTFLSGMNIVREQELGTMEQLNVTPIRKSEFIIGKLLPLWIIGLGELAVGLAVARWGFGIPFLGSVSLIFVIAAVYLLVVQGIGLLISTVSNTQQQAMFVSWFLMVVFILMGGLFTPIDSMPQWAQQLTLLNPVAYFIKIMRLVLLKGAGVENIWRMASVLLLMGVLVISISVRRYRKVSL